MSASIDIESDIESVYCWMEKCLNLNLKSISPKSHPSAIHLSIDCSALVLIELSTCDLRLYL